MARPSLIEILKKTGAYFNEKGIDNPQLNAELLLAHVLQCKRLDLYLRFNETLSDDVLDPLRPLVIRRAKREPLQYILTEVEISGLKLKVDRRVLIPRPETEELIEQVVERFSQPHNILDLGTGSGLIAIALARRYPKARVVAVDKSPEALSLAQENAKSMGVSRSVTFLQSDWFQNVPGTFDWILSNPPYLSETEWQDSQPEILNFEPKEALVASDSGRADLHHILQKAPAFLNPNGVIALEMGATQGPYLLDLAHSLGYHNPTILLDLSKKERFFVAQTAGTK